MLVIRTPKECLEYLEARLKMSTNQQTCTTEGGLLKRGMEYAYEESIKAVKALIEYYKCSKAHAKDNSENSVDSSSSG